MKIRLAAFGAVSVFVMFVGISQVTFAENRLVTEGISAFRNSDFENAVLKFREVIRNKPNSDDAADAYFWIAKSAMAMSRLSEAERGLEYYLRTFPDHIYAIEARYQRGRILFMREDYEGAIQAFTDFIRSFGDSPFVANATYWSGESLFNLGRLDEAKRIFQSVLRDYPTSFRVEAARYRIALIELNAREQELLRLLHWSHEEHLQALDEFKKRDRAYQEVIVSYQTRIQNAAGEDHEDEITWLTAQVRTLQELLRKRDAEIDRLKEQLISTRNDREAFEPGGGSNGQ